MKQNKMYCVKCRKEVTPHSLEIEHDSRGRLRLKGICPISSTLTFKYISEDTAKKLISTRRR